MAVSSVTSASRREGHGLGLGLAILLLDVDVHRQDGQLVLVVTDDGDGFDPTADRDPTSFGLRGLASLVQDEGGRLDVRSAPGEGTEVRMEVRVR